MEIYEQGLDEYSKSNIVISNFLMAFWIGLGTIACWFFYSLIAWIYLFSAIIMVFIVLRKLVCINCYYYNKWCYMGWGKLSALFFKKGNIKNFKTSTGLKIAPLTYGLLSIVPLTLIFISIFQEFLLSKLIVLILLILVSSYSIGGRKKICKNCKMRIICPGSAAKI